MTQSPAPARILKPDTGPAAGPARTVEIASANEAAKLSTVETAPAAPPEAEKPSESSPEAGG